VSELQYEYLGTLTCGVGEAQVVGKTPKGVRRIMPLTGGRFEGPKLNGEVLPFGADWILIRSDGLIELDVRATIKTDDGEIIYAQYKGIYDPSRKYFCTVPIFETSSEKYSWLNKSIYVGLGSAEPGKVIYKIYQII